MKQVSDICISLISQIEEFPRTQENAVFEYAEKHKSECFDSLADDVELLDFSKMVLSDWKVEKGTITLASLMRKPWNMKVENCLFLLLLPNCSVVNGVLPDRAILSITASG